MNPHQFDPQVHKLLFHYVPTYQIARMIMDSSHLYPDRSDEVQITSLYDLRFFSSRVNLTNAAPEEGREAVSIATSLEPGSINYGLEILVERARVRNIFEQFPRSFQILSDKPVPIKVLYLRNMDKIGRGYTIRRILPPLASFPMGFYAPQPT